MANIWADMTCAFCPDERLLRTSDGVTAADIAALRRSLIRARVDAAESAHYSAAGAQAVLDRLLDGGHITFEEYLDRLPDGILPGRSALLASRRSCLLYTSRG